MERPGCPVKGRPQGSPPRAAPPPAPTKRTGAARCGGRGQEGRRAGEGRPHTGRRRATVEQQGSRAVMERPGCPVKGRPQGSPPRAAPPPPLQRGRGRRGAGWRAGEERPLQRGRGRRGAGWRAGEGRPLQRGRGWRGAGWRGQEGRRRRATVEASGSAGGQAVRLKGDRKGLHPTPRRPRPYNDDGGGVAQGGVGRRAGGQEKGDHTRAGEGRP
jgi:hypothetical protein